MRQMLMDVEIAKKKNTKCNIVGKKYTASIKSTLAKNTLRICLGISAACETSDRISEQWNVSLRYKYVTFANVDGRVIFLFFFFY